MSEKAKYDGIYADPKFAKYGHSNHGSRSLRLVEKMKPSSVLDVGCGWNEFIKSLSQLTKSTTLGMDFSCPGADIIGDAKAIPFPDKQFDLLTSFDALEHLLPEEVDLVLAEMARVSQRFIFSISYVASVNKWQGQTLHPTVRNEEWWMTRIMRAGGIAIEKSGRYIVGKWTRPLSIAPDARVVIVGNGPSILRQNLGSVIDGFDEVIRFNNFKIEGFEKHTGVRTTLWSTFFRRIDPPMRHNRVLCPHESDSPPPECDDVYKLPSWFYNRTRRMAQERSYWLSGMEKNIDPILASSGLLVAAYLLDVVGVNVVHAAGFDHFGKKKSGMHHYWIPSSFKQPAEHDGDSERVMFEELADAGRIRHL